MLSRIRQVELMDDLYLDPGLHTEALCGLARLNAFSIGAYALWKELENLVKSKNLTSLRILDLATGGGDIPISLSNRAHALGWTFEFVGADRSLTAIEFARGEAQKEGAPVSFIHLDVLKDELPLHYDVIMTSLFTHHLDPPEVINLLERMAMAAKHLLLVNDLVRSEFSLASVWLATRLLTNSKIVRHDGIASVRAAYTVSEMKNMAAKAELNNCLVKECFPCRQLLVWKKS